MALVQNSDDLKTEVKQLRRPSALDLSVATEMYFYDYYWDLLTYIGERKKRKEAFEAKARIQGWTQDVTREEWAIRCREESAFLRKRRTRLGYNEFQVLCQIGKGGYGEVFLSLKKDTKEICALKRMRKKALMVQDEVHHIRNERNVLTATDSRWLVKLLYSFQDTTYVYLAMEFVPGGDMRTLLNGSGVLHESHARFYMMEMCLCVAALHRLGFIHRDLKPENFLIAAQGHLKLTDFGLAKGNVSKEYRDKLRTKLDNIKDRQIVKYSSVERRTMYQTIRAEDRTRAFSLVGSPDYMAPEMLKNEGYDLLVDYWSLGCIFFELLAAFPPFGAPTVDEIWINVFNWQDVLDRPVYQGADKEFNMSDEAWNLIESLITTKANRLHSPVQVQQHPWFQGFDWSTVKNMRPPFIPDLTNEHDVQYFDDFTNPEDIAKYQGFDGPDLDDDDMDGKNERELWVGWTFRGRDRRYGHEESGVEHVIHPSMELVQRQIPTEEQLVPHIYENLPHYL